MMKNLIAHVHALLVLVNQKTDIFRYKLGTAILRLPFMDSGTALKIKLKIAGFIANDQNTV